MHRLRSSHPGRKWPNPYRRHALYRYRKPWQLRRHRLPKRDFSAGSRTCLRRRAPHRFPPPRRRSQAPPTKRLTHGRRAIHGAPNHAMVRGRMVVPKAVARVVAKDAVAVDVAAEAAVNARRKDNANGWTPTAHR